MVPFGALAARLVAEGHEAIVVTHERLTGLLPAGVPSVPVASDPQELLAGPAGAAVRRGDPRALNRTRHHFADFVHSFDAPAGAALQGANVLVASTFAIAAVDAALARGVPVVRAHLWPEMAGLDGPMPLLPYSWALPRRVRRVARRALRSLEVYLGGLDGWWERGRLQLRPHHRAGLTTATHGSLHAYSPVVGPAGGPGVDVTGWWVPERDGGLSAQTAALLDGAGEWVYVGFGSMHQGRPERLVEAAARACALGGVRGIVQLPGMSGTLGAGLVAVGEEPHDELFARVAAVVHHGGSGTTGSALRAGTPSVVVPHFADQYYWGHRLASVGVAPRALPRRRLTADRLARRLDRALSDPVRERASRLGGRVRAEDGTGAAVRCLERLPAGHSS